METALRFPGQSSTGHCVRETPTKESTFPLQDQFHPCGYSSSWNVGYCDRNGGLMKVFLADDSLSVRELLVELLADLPGVTIVGQTADAFEATESIRTLKPDVVILDLRLLRGSGLGVLATL